MKLVHCLFGNCTFLCLSISNYKQATVQGKQTKKRGEASENCRRRFSTRRGFVRARGLTNKLIIPSLSHLTALTKVARTIVLAANKNFGDNHLFPCVQLARRRKLDTADEISLMPRLQLGVTGREI